MAAGKKCHNKFATHAFSHRVQTNDSRVQALDLHPLGVRVLPRHALGVQSDVVARRATVLAEFDPEDAAVFRRRGMMETLGRRGLDRKGQNRKIRKRIPLHEVSTSVRRPSASYIYCPKSLP